MKLLGEKFARNLKKKKKKERKWKSLLGKVYLVDWLDGYLHLFCVF